MPLRLVNTLAKRKSLSSAENLTTVIKAKRSRASMQTEQFSLLNVINCHRVTERDYAPPIVGLLRPFHVLGILEFEFNFIRYMYICIRYERICERLKLERVREGGGGRRRAFEEYDVISKERS